MSGQSRQLAAIMFTDIVGYTALMGKDEQNAFELLNKNRQIQKPIIGQYNGRWIKELGDGVMASFNTVSDAVNAAIKIQQTCNTAKDFQLRIGIHLGEVVFENDDVFGDGVNIASRIQALAPPGGIWISESVYNNVSNKIDIDTEFVKTEHLKNVKDPVRIYQVKVEGLEAPEPVISISKKSESTDTRTLGNKRTALLAIGAVLILASGYFIYTRFQKTINGKEVIDRSIAVLPFTDMSPNHDHEYFGDGIAEAIINGLSQINDLKVIARSSSFQFKGRNEDLGTIGEMLGVATALEGSIKKSGDKIRVTATLTKTIDGTLLWSETFDRNLKDYLLIQDEITNMIVEALKVSFTGELQLSRHMSIKEEAIKEYQQGRYFHDRNGQGDARIALNYFSQAVKIDSGFALAWAYRATSAGYADSTFTNLRRFNQIAMDLNPNLAEAHVNLGQIHWYDLNFVQAEKEFRIALSLGSNHPRVLRNAGRALSCLGLYQEGLELCKKAVYLDPLQSWSYLWLTHAFAVNGQFNEALTAWRKENEISNRNGFSTQAHLLVLNGQGREALKLVDKINNEEDRLFLLTVISFSTNQKGKADEYLQMFKNKYGSTSPLAVCEMLVFCSQKEEALQILSKVVLTKLLRWPSPDVYFRSNLYLKGSPYLIPIRNDPRFKAATKKFNYPELK